MRTTNEVLLGRRVARFAAIDLGSNAIRLQIVEPTDEVVLHSIADLPEYRPQAWRRILYERVPVRMGGDVFSHRKVRHATMDAACAAFAEFRRALDLASVHSYRAVATSAVREAENQSRLISRIRESSGIVLDVISGEEEAELISLAIRRQVAPQAGLVVLLDLGGGSTEISELQDGVLRRMWSLPLGTVRLLESRLPHSSGLSPELQLELQQHIDSVLAPVIASIGRPVAFAIATGGNAKALARRCPPVGYADGRIDVGRMRQLLAQLAPLSPQERSAAYGFESDRADVIVPAAAVLERAAAQLGVSTLIAPEIGLKDGVLSKLIDEVRVRGERRDTHAGREERPAVAAP